MLRRAAVVIGAIIDAVAEELLQQIAIRAMHLDAVTTGVHGVARCLPEVAHDPRQFVQPQRARGGNIFEALGGKSLGLGAARRARDGLLPTGQQGRVGDSPHMPELHHELAALPVDGIGNGAPATDLRSIVDARSVQVTLACR